MLEEFLAFAGWGLFIDLIKHRQAAWFFSKSSRCTAKSSVTFRCLGSEKNTRLNNCVSLILGSARSPRLDELDQSKELQ